MEIDFEKSNIRAEVKNWIDQNRELLPLNIDGWKVSVFDQLDNNADGIVLGKYEALIQSSTPFYKPISKLFKL